MSGEDSFKFSGQAYPGFNAHEAKAISVQPQKTPEQVNLKPAVESVLGGVAIGIVIVALSSRRLENSVSTVINMTLGRN